MSKKLNHIAIAVPDLEEARAFYKNIMNCPVSEPIDLPEHGVTTVFVTLDNTKIELLGIFGENSPIEKFLEKNPKGGIHHICLEVKNIDKEVSAITKQGIRALGDIKNGAHDMPVIFFHPKDCFGTLIELEESTKKT